MYKSFQPPRAVNEMELVCEDESCKIVDDKGVLERFQSLYSSLEGLATEGNNESIVATLREINSALEHYQRVCLHQVLDNAVWLEVLENLVRDCPYAEVCHDAIMCIYCTASSDDKLMAALKQRENLPDLIVDALDRFGSAVLHPSRLALDATLSGYDANVVAIASRVLCDREVGDREFYVDMACIFRKIISFWSPDPDQEKADAGELISALCTVLRHGVFEHALDALLMLADETKFPEAMKEMAMPSASDPKEKVVMDYLIDMVNVWQNLPPLAVQMALALLCRLVRHIGGMRTTCMNGLAFNHAMELFATNNSEIQNQIGELLYVLCNTNCEIVRRITDYSFVEVLMCHAQDQPYSCQKNVISAVAKIIYDKSSTTSALLDLTSDRLLEHLGLYLEQGDDESILSDVLIACFRILRVPELQERFVRVLGPYFSGTELDDRLSSAGGAKVEQVKAHIYLIRNQLERLSE